jgi:CBS domain containing-hemolysin-like protein
VATNSIIWLVVSFCLGLSFFLSGMEAGVFALSRLRIRQQSRAGLRSARLLLEYLENPENFLWTILVGNTVANALILGCLVLMLYQYLNGRVAWFVPVYAVAVFLFYALFDFLPKMLFRTFPTRLCVFFARPFRWVHLLLGPLVAAVETVSQILLRWRGGKVFTGHLFGNREELRSVMQDSAQTLTSEERAMINRVLDLQTLTVRQVMTPLSRAATVTTQTTLAEVLRICKETKLTRLPVWQTRDNKTRIIGLLHLNSLLFQPALDISRLVGEYTKPALYLDEDLRLEVALRRMQRGGQRLAIVLARDRNEIGILSLQDVLKIIVGEVSL